jgi:S-DNA-T family DNA segregation ATPase FtsK/SpoIIIE
MVGLGSLLSAPEWQDPKPLLLALGKGVSGIPVFGNLSKMPHLLIAGTTGSGKSVMVHAIINSLLFRNSPSDLKFIMVDPKKVELTLYNNIPHLYTPVITNAKVAIRTLNWAVNEMERRYDILESFTERDITSYHKNVFQKAVLKEKNNPDAFLPERMPYIVVIIDELADIMMSYPKELESAIVRLAQKSRAVGIHLILSTQRPSVNVITGLIKANIPSRIALKVASQIDSRTIIDTGGAEQLLGQGDLLFTSSENPKQERVQSAFVSDQEVKKVVEYLKDKYRNMIPDEINVESAPAGTSTSVLYGADFEKAAGGDDEDDLYEEAKEIVISSRKASTSYLQRRLKIGYSRAARLMDMLEDKGIIGAGDGAKPREVLVEGGEVESEDYNNTNF